MGKKTKLKIEINTPKFKYEVEGQEYEILGLAIKALKELQDATRGAATP